MVVHYQGKLINGGGVGTGVGVWEKSQKFIIGGGGQLLGI